MSVFSFDPKDNESSNVSNLQEFAPEVIKPEQPVGQTVDELFDEQDETIQRLAAELAVIRADADSMKADLAGDEEFVDTVNKIIKALREQIDAETAKRHAKENEMADRRRELKNRLFDADLKERELRQAQANALARKKFLEDSAGYDLITANAPWREWALPHQIEGAKILATAGRALLADKMGLGKTLTSLIMADMLQVKKVLVVVPDDIIGNFNREIHHWAPHRQLMTLGKLSKAERDVALFAMRMMDEYICTINYSAWRKDKGLLDAIVTLKFEMVIADEAHTMKTTTTSAYRGVRKIVLSPNACPNCGADIEEAKSDDHWRKFMRCTLCDWRSDDVHNKEDFYGMSSVKYVLPMTGTPILNKPQDLFAQLSLIDPVEFHELNDYLRLYCVQDWYTGKWKFQTGGLESLTKKLASRYLARDRKSAGVVLPPQTIQIHEVEIDAEIYAKQHEVIEQLTQSAQIVLNEDKKMNMIAMIALITRKRQANIFPAGIEMRDSKGDLMWRVGDEFNESAKLDYVLNVNDPNEPTGLAWDLVEGGIGYGERIVLFSQFKGPLKELESRFNTAGISVVRLDGDTPENLREQIKIDFDKKYCDQPGYTKRWQVVLCNFRVGGQGLNFTDCTQMIITDEEWNPGKNEQAYMRIDRMGQTKETTVHVLRSPRTIDTWMAALNEEKAAMIEGFESNIDMQQELLKAIQNGEF